MCTLIGLPMIRQERSGAPRRRKYPGCFFVPRGIQSNSIEQYLERETRLASSVLPIEIKGGSVIPETGMDLILEVYQEQKKQPFQATLSSSIDSQLGEQSFRRRYLFRWIGSEVHTAEKTCRFEPPFNLHRSNHL